MGKRGRKHIIDYASIKKGHYVIVPMEMQAAVRNSASCWGRTYGGQVSVRIHTSTTGYKSLRVYRVR